MRAGRRFLLGSLGMIAAAGCSQRQTPLEERVLVVAGHQPHPTAPIAKRRDRPLPPPVEGAAMPPAPSNQAFEDISRDIARRTIAAAPPIDKEKTIWIP